MNQSQRDGSPVYRQLDPSIQEVRLLHVSQTLQDDRIDCHLAHSALKDAKFVVLSYRWGDEDATYEIYLEGQPFKVRRNLWEFLNVIRQQTGMMLWIDALCINQADTNERSQQVQIMGDIFRSANMVLSWLGPAEESTKAVGKAFQLMDMVWNSSYSSPVMQNLDDSLAQFESLPAIDIGDSQDDVWEHVAFLCSLMYWNR